MTSDELAIRHRGDARGLAPTAFDLDRGPGLGACTDEERRRLGWRRRHPPTTARRLVDAIIRHPAAELGRRRAPERRRAEVLHQPDRPAGPTRSQPRWSSAGGGLGQPVPPCRQRESTVASARDRIRRVFWPRPCIVNHLLLEQDERLPVRVPVLVRHVCTLKG